MLEQVSLKPFNTFGINAFAKYFAEFNNAESLGELLSSEIATTEKLFILGGGSNILFTKNFDGLVLKNDIKGILKIDEDESHVYIKAGAGESWHGFVEYCLANNYAGIENLSLIPGSTGASPMQNIGAYGVELKDIFHCLDAFHIKDKTIVAFDNKSCEFGYRDSVFKNKYKGQFIITSVTYRLNKIPSLNISYGAIKQELDKMNVQNISIQQIANAVINIRRSKLPDPTEIGNAGSFFKNPVVDATTFKLLQQSFPGIIGHNVYGENVKLAAGWLIESCGWKGYRKGDAGCHEKQALVLVNYGNASGDEILALSEKIMQSVKQKFNVSLEREVNIL
ncbi:MAG: UDP-N-acetylmuramate dehydrogenase [Ferruginibacter sp.]